jgi:hypothetical protein
MAAASKSDGAEAKKKSSMPRIFLGLWLVALTVLLVILFTYMPEREGTPGRPLTKKISAPSPDELKALMAEKADKQAVDRLEGRVAEIARKSEGNGKEIAVLDRRVNRLETTVSDRHNLPADSFPEIAPAPPESGEPAPSQGASEKSAPETAAGKTGKAADQTAGQTADQTIVKKPIEITANQPVPPRPADPSGAEPAATEPAGGQQPGAPEVPETGPAPSDRPAESTTAPPEPSPSVAQKETPADRRSVEEKIAAREAYIRRTAPQRRAARWETVPGSPDRAGIAPPAPDRRQRGRTPEGAGFRRSYSPGGDPAGPRRPAGSLHRFSRRFGHRVDLSKRLEGTGGTGGDGLDIPKTAPGMTIFSDRRLDLPNID